jgi:hypothetical protein
MVDDEQAKVSEIENTENFDEENEQSQQETIKNHMNAIIAMNLLQLIIEMIMRNMLSYSMAENSHILH